MRPMTGNEAVAACSEDVRKPSPQSVEWQEASRPAIWATAAGLFAIFLFSSVQTPAFHADPQYYVQSAILWPQGKLSFAASWIGSRDLVVLLYHLMFVTFGPSLDSLSIGLALVSLCTNMAIAVTVFSLVRNPLAAAVVTLAAALTLVTLTAAYVTSIMQSPASDNLAVLALAAMWALWSLGWQGKESAKLFFWLPLVAGIAFHVRGELIVFPAIAALGAAPWSRVISWQVLAARSAIAAGVLALGLVLPGLLWPLWVDGAKPYAYKGAYLIFYPFEEFARGTNGPASAALADQLGLAPEASIPFWDAMAVTYSRFGAKASDDMLTRAGLEAARQNLLPWLEKVVESARILLVSPASISVARTTWEKRTEDVRKLLENLDRQRAIDSAKYGNDATARTTGLADRHIPILVLMRSVIPPMQIATVLPGAICALIPLLLLGFARRLGRAHAAVLLPPALYGIFVLLLGAFTNGAHSRYLTPLLGFNLIVALIIFAIAAEKRRDGVDVTRRCPGGAT